MEGHLASVSSEPPRWIQVALDLDASLDVAGQILPVGALAGVGASATALELRPSAHGRCSGSNPGPGTRTRSPGGPTLTSGVSRRFCSAPRWFNRRSTAHRIQPNDTAVVPEPAVAELDDRRKNEAAADAFAGAFGSMMAPAPTPEPVDEPEPEPVTDEERFLAADEDESGGFVDESWQKPRARIWKSRPGFMPLQTSTETGRSRWKNSSGAKRLK